MRVALSGLTMAEYFRDVKNQDVLLFIDNIFRFTQAGSEAVSYTHLGSNIPAQGGQTAVHRAVQLGAFDVQPDAAQHCRIDLCFQVDGLAGELFQLFVQALCLLLRHCHCSGRRCFQNAVCLIVAHTVSPCTAGQLSQGALLAQDLQKVQHIEVDLIPQCFIQQAAALSFRDAGGAEQMQVVRVCLKKRHGFVQLTQNAGLQPFLRRQIVQASAVHPCSLGHDASPTFLINSSIRSLWSFSLISRRCV